jgi:hypothetical protein
MTRKRAKAPTRSTQTLDKNKNLTAWLRKQARKLKDLTAKGQRLKLDFVAIARAKGSLLREVKKRLETTSLGFEEWVEQNTDIGYSTALLWMDVAQNYAKVKARFADSNPLELTVRQVRDAIRDDRQAQGKGKPRSGKRKAATSPKMPRPFVGENAPQRVHKNSLSWALRERWALNKTDPDFKPEKQSEADFAEARLCFQQAINPDSTYATVAKATGKDEEEVKRLLRELDIDRVDTEWAEFRRQAEDKLTASQKKRTESQHAKWEATLAKKAADKKHEAAEGVTLADLETNGGKDEPEPPPFAIHINIGCKRFRIEAESRLTCLDGNGHLITLVAEDKDIAKQLMDALSAWEGGK